jgi:hypothetical protein
MQDIPPNEFSDWRREIRGFADAMTSRIDALRTGIVSDSVARPQQPEPSLDSSKPEADADLQPDRIELLKQEIAERLRRTRDDNSQAVDPSDDPTCQ